MNEQQDFWKGDFGNDYILRNNDKNIISSNIRFFSKSLKNCKKLNSILEFGANIGLNLHALNKLFPKADISGVEINENAYKILKANNFVQAYHTSIENFESINKCDLTFTKGVLIHINPDLLPLVYEKLYFNSNKYILIAEYYSDHPEEINYRGFKNKLFKRDYAGEILEKFKNIKLIDYGFIYKRDANFISDSINWFLFEK